MATTYTWNISGVKVVSNEASPRVYAAWNLSGESSDTFTFYTPGGEALTANYSGGTDGNTEIDLAVTSNTTQEDVILAVQIALGDKGVSDAEAAVDAAIQARKSEQSAVTNYGFSGAPLPWNVAPPSPEVT